MSALDIASRASICVESIDVRAVCMSDRVSENREVSRGIQYEGKVFSRYPSNRLMPGWRGWVVQVKGSDEPQYSRGDV